MPHDPDEPRMPPLPPGRRNDPIEDETGELVRDTQRELWDTARPESLHPDDVDSLAADDRKIWASSTEVQDMLMHGEDPGGGEPLRARSDELPTGGAVDQESYSERPYWALAVVTIGVAVLLATIIGNLAILPFLFERPPAIFTVGWPWVIAALVGVLVGLAVARGTWPRDHYGQIWGPALAATFAGVLVAVGALAAIWYLVPLGA